MLPTILQFPTLSELANYARYVHDKGFQINTLKLTLKTKLTEDEIILAMQQFRAEMLERRSN